MGRRLDRRLHAPDADLRGPKSGKEFDEPRAVRLHDGEPTARVSGPVEQLARWAWVRRPEEGGVAVTGTETALAAIDRLMAQGIQ